MDALQISTGEKRIPIVRDGVHVGEIAFNPNDALFAEKFYRLIGKLQTTLGEYEAKSIALDKDTRLDENQMPANMDARFELVKEVCQYLRGEIDSLFGANTSQIVFGDALAINAFEQFLNGILPFIQSARVSKVAKYTKKHK